MKIRLIRACDAATGWTDTFAEYKGTFELHKDTTEVERLFVRHCLSPLFNSGYAPLDLALFKDKLPFARMLVEAHNGELEIMEG